MRVKWDFVSVVAELNINDVFLRGSCSNCPNEAPVKPFRTCGNGFSPVCGTNNVTYTNDCEFENAQCLAGGTFYRQPIQFCDGIYIFYSFVIC